MVMLQCFKCLAIEVSCEESSFALTNSGILSGANINVTGPRGDTLFHLAAYNGHVDAMKWLHDIGKNTTFI
jgi:ankyrin repeat protein